MHRIIARVTTATASVITDVMKKTSCLFFCVTIGCPTANAALSRVTIHSDEAIQAPRWILGSGEIPRGASFVATIARAKRASVDGLYRVCLNELDAAASHSEAKKIGPWLAKLELQCALDGASAPNAQKNLVTADRLHQAVKKLERHTDWLWIGPASAGLRVQMIDAYLVSLERDLVANPKRAEQSLQSVDRLLSYADEKQRATFWRLSAEWALVDGQARRDSKSDREKTAIEFLKRSLEVSENEQARARLLALETPEPAAAPLPALQSGAAPALTDSTVGESGGEKEWVEKVNAALRSGDLSEAANSAARIIVSYPGSPRAKWASERLLETLIAALERKDPSRGGLGALSGSLKSRVLKAMEAADGDRQAEWARALYNRGYWQEALTLSKNAVQAMRGERLTAVLDIAADAALASDRFELALEYSQRLIDQHPGTQAAREALLRAGLIHYRQGRYELAASGLEKLMKDPQVGSLEMTARHWRWRSLQKLKSPLADREGDELASKFTFGYYGLRARLERQGSQFEWNPPGSRVSVDLHLSSREQGSLERARLLLKGGWLDEAQAEIKELYPARTADEKAIRALLWAAAGQFVQASKLANEAWDAKGEFRRFPFLAAAFPIEFVPQIDKHASARRLDSVLVRSLIKQESAFNARAVSTSKAMGLMQMIPATAREIARDLKLAPLNLPDDLFQPERNIQMGSYYLSRLLSKYQGHVPLALAAYNAGPARLDRWLKARSNSLKDLSAVRSSDPHAELWLDEIPYTETSVYVKSILRNLLIYKIIDLGRVEIPDPLWSLALPPTPKREPVLEEKPIDY